MLRDWKTLAILLLVAILILKMIPPDFSIGGIEIAPGNLGGGPSTGSTAKPITGHQSTSTPAAVDPQRLKEELHPFIILRSGAVRRDGPIVVGGNGFTPNQELAITMQREGDDTSFELGAVRADKNGALPDATLELPAGIAHGNYRIIATPSQGGAAVEASLIVDSSQTWGRLTSETAKPKGVVGFEGGGFIPGENVSLHLDSLGNPPLVEITASDQGTVSGVFRVPIANEGSHVVLLYGNQSRMPVETQLSILGFYPWVELDNYSPAPEQAVGFAGMDFAPGEIVYVFLNSTALGPVTAVRVGPDGTFKVPGALKLLPGVQGKHRLIFIGSQSQLNVEAEFTIQPYPGALELTLYAGPPGSEVAFIGNGFASGEEVRAYVGKSADGQQVATFAADSTGTFQGAGTFRVPKDAKAGELTLTVVGQVSGITSSVVFSVLPLSPWIEAKQDQTGRIAATGHGFAAGEEVEMILGKDEAKPSATAIADKNGNAQFEPQPLGNDHEGAILIQLKGLDSGGQAELEFFAGPAPEGGGEPDGQDRGGLEFEMSPGSTDATPTAEPRGR